MITYEKARKLALEMDPEVDRCSEWDLAWSFIAKRKRFSLSDPAIFVLKENGDQPIGSISAVELNEKVALVQIGYCLGREWWHQGIMSEAFSRVIDFFFEEVA